MNADEAKRMLDEAWAAKAQAIRLHPETIAVLKRDFAASPTYPWQPTPLGTPVLTDPSVAVGAWEFVLRDTDEDRA
jgi:hypothetical protein